MPPTARRVATAVALVAVLLSGCGGGPSAEDERRRLADDLLAEVGGGLGRQEADCVAGRLQEEFGDDAFRQVLEAAEAGGGERTDSVRSTVIDIFAACDALEAVATTDG